MKRSPFVAIISLALLNGYPRAAELSVAVESAHREVWRRFIDGSGIFLDFADLDGKVSIPTPEECREGKPNALGWWAPIENGAMFNGLYMEAAVNRWKRTRSGEDAQKAHKLMEGLLLLNSISEVKGFVGRGVSTDGKSHYPMGSNDQTLPWFLGLWRYRTSEMATEQERARIDRHWVETAEEIIHLGWRMPAEAPFGTRGSFEGFHFEETARKLFVLKTLHQITGEAKWQEMYLGELEKRGGEKNLSKREVLAAGMAFFYAKTHNWTSCTAVGALRGLWEQETDPVLKADFGRGLVASARLAAESLPLAWQWNNQDASRFEMDWRVMNEQWRPQRNESESQALAMEQLKSFLKVAPRRIKETSLVREPTSAAWIVSLCPDLEVIQQHREAIDRVLASYDYSRLYYSQFFWVEMAWERLKGAG